MNLFLYKVLKTPLGLYISFFLHFKLLYNNWFPDFFFFHFLFSLKSAMIWGKKRQKEIKMSLARRQGGEKKKDKNKTSNMKILRDNAFINAEMVTTKMVVMSGYIYIYIYIYLYINPCPATDHGT